MHPGLILQHEPNAPAGLFADWLCEREIPFVVSNAWEAAAPAEPAAFPWICSLGSDQTPGRPDALPWVDEEVDLLRNALAADVPVLGLCFGGQALAAAAGGDVHPADPEEVGWIEIETKDRERIPAGPWLYFHYDQLELPEEALELARSPAGPAAFALDQSLGLQFHPEVTGEIVAGWAQAENETLQRLGITPEDLTREAEISGAGARRDAWKLFDAWWEGLSR